MPRAFFKFIIVTLMMLTSSLAYGERNAQTCKEHLDIIFSVNRDAHLYNLVNGEISNIKGIKFSELSTKESDNPLVKKYIQDTNTAVARCADHCAGVPFNMSKYIDLLRARGIDTTEITETTQFHFNCNKLGASDIATLQYYLPAIEGEAKPAENEEVVVVTNDEFVEDKNEPDNKTAVIIDETSLQIHENHDDKVNGLLETDVDY